MRLAIYPKESKYHTLIKPGAPVTSPSPATHWWKTIGFILMNGLSLGNSFDSDTLKTRSLLPDLNNT